jgi:hypothetical protein
MSVAESSGFGSYQFVLTQYGNLKVNISGHGAGSYIDDAISPTTAYNIHAGNIINTIGSTLPLLSLDVNGLTKHVFQTNGNVSFNNTADMAAIVGIKGSGSTSATISLLVQNSAGNTAFQVKDDLNANFQGRIQIEYDKISFLGSPSNTYIEQSLGLGIGFYSAAVSNQIMINAQPKIIVKDTGASRASTLIVGHNVPTTDAADVSALLEVRSDATYLKGFLPPRMTTAQKNLIASPAIGLQIFDTDLNRPCFYNGAWVTL